MKRFRSSLSLILCMALVITGTPLRPAFGGIPSEVVGIENETGGAVFDNTVGIGSGAVGDKGAEIAEEGLKNLPQSGGYKWLGRTSKVIKWGGFIIGTVDTVRDTYNIFAENSKHPTWIGRWTDKGIMIVGTAMGWAATIGTIATIGATAPVTGTAAVVTGTGFAIAAAGVAVTRAVFNTEAVRIVENILSGNRRAIGFAPLETPNMREGRKIIEEELGFDLYDHSNNEIPDPNTGIPVYKPNIYLYSGTDRTVTVRVWPESWITESIPEYDPIRGWRAEVRNGTLNGNGDYLFYEALVPDAGFQKQRGWVLEGGSHDGQLKSVLAQYGFNRKETADFLEYWSDKLDAGATYAMYPQETAIVDAVMPLGVDPVPENIARIWFYFEKTDPGTVLAAPGPVTPLRHDGYCVVEWGGLLRPETPQDR